MGEISQYHYYQFTDIEIKTEVKGLVQGQTSESHSHLIFHTLLPRTGSK